MVHEWCARHTECRPLGYIRPNIMLSLIASLALLQAAPQAVAATITFDPVGLSAANNRAKGLMFRPSRATEVGDDYSVQLGNGPKSEFRIRLGKGSMQVDANHDGRFDNDPTVKVETINPSEPGDPVSYQATAVFPASYSAAGKTWSSPYGLNFYWIEGRKGLFYYRAGLAKGTINLGGRKLQVELYEEENRGVFGERFDTVKDPATAKSSNLIIQGGFFDARGSFVIDGVNYLPEVSVDGRTVRLVPSFKVVVAPARKPVAEIKLLAEGTPAPDFTVEKYEGGTTKLSEHRGKVVILKFWATWCGPCKASMPHFQEIFEKTAPQGVDLLAVCVADERDLFKNWVKENSGTYKFPFSFDPAGTDRPNAISRKLYGVTGIPTVYIIDRKGKVSTSIVGYEGPNDHRVEEALAKLGVKF